MAQLALTVASDILKEDYVDLKDQLNENFFILSQIDTNRDDFQGRRAFTPIHVQRSSGVGSRPEGGALPTAGAQGYTHTLVPLRFHYGRIQVSGPVIAAMQSDKGSFIRAVQGEMDGITNDLKRDINRQIWGTSNGVIATCGTTTATTVVQLAATTTQVQMRQLGADGSKLNVDIGTVATPTSIIANSPVSAFDAVNLTITIGSSVTTTAAARVFRTGAGGASSNSGDNGDGQAELTGLQTIVSNAGVLHAVDPAVVPQWKATVNGNAGVTRALSESLVNQQIHAAEIASGMEVDLLIGSPGVSRAAAVLQQSIRRNIDNVDLKAGYRGLAWSTPMEGIGKGSKTRALYWEKDTPQNQLFGIASSSLIEHVMNDWDWMNQDGAVLNRILNTDSYEATFFRYSELACSQRNANFVLQDLQEA